MSCHMSHVTCHMAYVTCQHVMCKVLLFLHRIGPLGRFDLVVAMSGCCHLSVCVFVHLKLEHIRSQNIYFRVYRYPGHIYLYKTSYKTWQSNKCHTLVRYPFKGDWCIIIVIKLWHEFPTARRLFFTYYIHFTCAQISHGRLSTVGDLTMSPILFHSIRLHRMSTAGLSTN